MQKSVCGGGEEGEGVATSPSNYIMGQCFASEINYVQVISILNSLRV